MSLSVPNVLDRLAFFYLSPFSSTPMSRSSSSSSSAPSPLLVQQLSFSLSPRSRGCHLVTSEVMKAIGSSLSWVKAGTLHLFIQHTSASLTINENADRDVRTDMESWLNTAILEGTHWIHDSEGKDDMPAHVKASVFGSSVTVPITNGQLNLGTWQGIWLGEHRDHGGARRIVATIQGSAREQ